MRIPLHQFLMAAFNAGPTTPDSGSLADAATVDPGITLDTSSPPPGLVADFVSPGDGISLMLTDGGMPTGAAPWTLCGWVNTSVDSYHGFFGWGTLGETDFTYVQTYLQPSGQLALYASSSGYLYGTAAVNDGNWHHVAITFDGAAIHFYVDGSADEVNIEGGFPAPVNTVPLDITLGGTLYLASDYGGNYFDGSMADFRVYDYALSLGEINAIYNAQSTDPGNVWGYPSAASFPAGSMGALVNTIGSATAPSTGQIAAAILANPSNLLSTDNSGGVSLSTSQTFDGVSTQSLLELLVAAFVTGKASVVNNGNGTSTITRYKQDGSTAKYSVTFKPDGTITGAAILA